MVFDFDVNFLAVLVSTIVSMIIGMLWYGPLFGKSWMDLMGFSKKDIDKAKKKGMAKYYVANLITTFLAITVLAALVDMTGAFGMSETLMVAFWAWFGFVAMITTGSVIWEGKPFKLYVLNVGYWLVALLVSAAIISVWV